MSTAENIGDYMAVTRLVHDGCQWNPARDRGSLPTDAHFLGTRAMVEAGGSIKYRLCLPCSRLPKWQAHKKVTRRERPL